MRRLLPLFLIFLLGCSKKQDIIQQQGEAVILKAMITGKWVVSHFNKGGTDITSDYSNYQFQFKDNGTVDAINSGIVERSGTWTARGDIQSQSITSLFPNVSNSLQWLNGTWDIRSTTWTSVDADQKTSTELRTLRLDKQ